MAELAFSNGETHTIPLYLQAGKHDENELENANLLANRVGRKIASLGNIDLPSLIFDGILPFDNMLRERLTEALETTRQYEEDIQFSVRMNSRKGLLTILFFNGNSRVPATSCSLTVPGGWEHKTFQTFLAELIHKNLQTQTERRRGMTRPWRTDAAVTNDRITSSPSYHRIVNAPGKNFALWMSWPDQRKMSFSLGTKDQEEAQRRAVLVLTSLKEKLAQGHTMSVSELRELIPLVKLSGNSGVSPRRQLGGSPLGTIRINSRHPEMSDDASSEILHCYVMVSGDEISGRKLQVDVVVPVNETLFARYYASINLPQVDAREAFQLRRQLWEFLAERLQAFGLAGGKFSCPDDFIFSIDNDTNRIQLSKAGIERFHSVLQGRLNSGFVKRAREEGYLNPFDLKIKRDDLYRMSEGLSLVKPSHPRITFEKIWKNGTAEPFTFSFSLVVRSDQGIEWFRQQIDADLETIETLARSLDSEVEACLRQQTVLGRNVARLIARRVVEQVGTRQQKNPS